MNVNTTNVNKYQLLCSSTVFKELLAGHKEEEGVENTNEMISK